MIINNSKRYAHRQGRVQLAWRPVTRRDGQGERQANIDGPTWQAKEEINGDDCGERLEEKTEMWTE